MQRASWDRGSDEHAVRRYEHSGDEGDKNATIPTGNQKAFRITCEALSVQLVPVRGCVPRMALVVYHIRVCMYSDIHIRAHRMNLENTCPRLVCVSPNQD